jgi:L-malate glycosyltransferase
LELKHSVVSFLDFQNIQWQNMKICLLANSASIHTQRWATSLVDQQLDVTVISLSPVKIPNVNSIHISYPKFLGKIGYLTTVGKINGLLRKIQPDVLHAHYVSSYGLLAALSNYHPLLISVWGSDIFDFPKESIINQKSIRFSLRNADAIASTSEMMAKETQLYIESDKLIYVTPFGVDTEIFRLNESYDYPSDEKTITIGIIKALEPKYGIHVLVDAFEKLASIYPFLRLIIVGSGSQKQTIERAIKNANLSDKVMMIPHVAHDRVPEYLNKIDIFVMPSQMDSESFGVAAVEASACGIPVVASNIGGLPEVVIDGKTGFLFPSTDVDALAEKIRVLIDSPTLRKEMGLTGRKFVEENYSWEGSVKKMIDIYDNLVSLPYVQN